MLSPIEALSEKLKYFFQGLDSYSQSLIVVSDLNDCDFDKIYNQVKSNYILEAPSFLEIYQETKFNSTVSAKAFYNSLKQKISSVLIFDRTDSVKILKSSSCLKILEGAVCSSPDSGSKWSVNYLNNKPFIFKGHIIMNLKRDDINWKLSKYNYLIRDGIVITDLNEYARFLNNLKL